MKYRGYYIRETTYRPPFTSPVPTQGIYAGDKLVAYAESVALAKRAIDAHTRSGIWQRREVKQDGA